MELFYENKEKSFHLREISRKLSLNPNTVFKALNDLENDDYVSHEKKGNQKRYSINKNSITYAIFSLFDIKEYRTLLKSRKRGIKYFLDSLSVLTVGFNTENSWPGFSNFNTLN